VSGEQNDDDKSFRFASVKRVPFSVRKCTTANNTQTDDDEGRRGKPIFRRTTRTRGRGPQDGVEWDPLRTRAGKVGKSDVINFAHCTLHAFRGSVRVVDFVGRRGRVPITAPGIQPSIIRSFVFSFTDHSRKRPTGHSYTLYTAAASSLPNSVICQGSGGKNPIILNARHFPSRFSNNRTTDHSDALYKYEGFTPYFFSWRVCAFCTTIVDLLI